MAAIIVRRISNITSTRSFLTASVLKTNGASAKDQPPKKSTSQAPKPSPSKSKISDATKIDPTKYLILQHNFVTAAKMLRLGCCQNRHEPIDLPDGVAIHLGRSPETKITDKACSRQHIQLTADYKKETVTLKQLGVNPSRFENEDVTKGEIRTLKIGDTFYFFASNYPYKILKSEASHSSLKTSEKRTIDSFFKTKSAKKQAEPSPKRSKVDVDNNIEESSDDEGEVAKKLSLLKTKNLVKTSEPTKEIKVQAKSGTNAKWEKSTANIGWSEFGDMIVYHSPLLYVSSKIAGFDMDSTLITTASGKTFAKDHNDWKILYSEVPGKMKKMHADEYKIVIFTNQLGIGKGKVDVKGFKFKVENILKKLGVPALVIAITKRGPNRKPNLGSWKWLEENGNGGIPINMNESFYVGDAAGRPKDWAPKKKKDFSCADRLFAMNLGIDFKTPEEFFLSQKPAKFNMPEFDPKSVNDNAVLLEKGEKIVSGKQEVVVLVGYPASGKSFVAKEYLVSKGYVHVNRDTMKTWQKCVAACEKALSDGKSVVIDNTNPDVQSRKRYIDCAKSKGCDCRCFVMQVSMEHARHNNRFRELSESDHDKVPDMVFYQYRKIFIEPKMNEGFSSIVKANFVPKFSSEDMRKKYHMYSD